MEGRRPADPVNGPPRQISTQGETCVDTTKAAPASDAIRPFRLNFSDSELAELRKRISATRRPDRETVKDHSPGLQLATMQKLARDWATDYDCRKVGARLNGLPNFVTQIDGLDIHFIHARPKKKQPIAPHRHARLARLHHRAGEDC
jgi:hypothetical protein